MLDEFGNLFYQVEQDWFKYAVNAIDVGGGADREFWQTSSIMIVNIYGQALTLDLPLLQRIHMGNAT